MSKSNSFSRFNIVDSSIITIALFCLLGYLTARTGHAGVNKIIEGSPKVAIEVYISGMKTRDINIFKVGDKSAITIRNQPIDPPLIITAVKSNPKEATFLSRDGKKL